MSHKKQLPDVVLLILKSVATLASEDIKSLFGDVSALATPEGKISCNCSSMPLTLSLSDQIKVPVSVTCWG